MFKKLMFAVVPMLMVATHVFAGDDVLSDVANLKASSISDASISIESGIGALDVDALASNAGSQKSTDAIEAGFRNMGYSNYGYSNYGYGYGYGNYGYNTYYNNCYSYVQPFYSTFYSYRPVFYSAYYPVYSYYWGCY